MGVGRDSAEHRPGRDGAEDAYAQDHRGGPELLGAEAERQGRDGGDQQQARAQPLQNVSGDEHRRILGSRE